MELPFIYQHMVIMKYNGQAQWLDENNMPSSISWLLLVNEGCSLWISCVVV